jgi:hypothetical protein
LCVNGTKVENYIATNTISITKNIQTTNQAFIYYVWVGRLKTDILSAIKYIVKMPFQYTVVTWTTNVPGEVEYYLNSGWILAGGVSVSVTGTDRGSPIVTTYAQALMKHMPSESSSITTKL